MALKEYRPTSPGRRGMTGYIFEEITKGKQVKALLAPLKKKAGRNNQGRITVRHRGGGARRKLRLLDYKRNKIGVPGKVVSIEYDPNRSAYIALIQDIDGEKRYILAPLGLGVGDVINSGSDAAIKLGNNLPMSKIPNGTPIHNVELKKGRGGQLVRSAGTTAQLMVKEGEYALIKLPSGEIRRIRSDCSATIGQIGNIDHQSIKLGKAGRKRWVGRRPEVRGSAMSPRDHPHGGGEGRSPVGMSGPKTPWGKPALGFKTRKLKFSDTMIVRHRRK